MNNSVKARFVSLLGLALISSVVQSQSSSFADTTAHSSNGSTSVSAVVAASIHTCSWYMENVPESISLSNPDNLEYIGQDLPLEAQDLADFSVFFSGDAEKGDRCSFYDEETGVELTMSVSGSGFYNSGSDDSLDWSFGDPMKDGSASQFSVSFIDQLDSCFSGFTTDFSPQVLNNGLGIPLNLKPLFTGPTVVSEEFDPYELPENNPTFAECVMSAKFQTSVPGGGMPSRPGQSYSFEGPTVTTTLTVLDSDPT
jgi:hypothetical protein